MCSALFLFRPRPLLALNFDFDHAFRLTWENEESFCMRIRFGELDGRPLGVHKDGRSANIQLAPQNRKALYRDGIPDAVHLRDVIDQILDCGTHADQIPAYLRTHTLLYSPDNIGAQCFCADRSGAVSVVNPGNPVLTEKDFSTEFVLLTNFALGGQGTSSCDRNGKKCKRYKTMYDMLRADHDRSVDRLFRILEAVKQTEGTMPTIYSMVAELDAGKIWFSLGGDFSRRFRFSFSDRSIGTFRGFGSERAESLTSEGLEASYLETWV